MAYVHEICPYCDEIITLVAVEGIIKCPVCGKYMVICSMCELSTCNHCKLEDIARSLNESN